MIGNYNDETNFRHISLLTNTQISRLCKDFLRLDSSANLKWLKTQLSNIGKPGGLSGRLLRTLLKIDFSLMENLLKQFTKSVLIPLGLTAVASARDKPIQKNFFGSGMTTLIISNDERTIWVGQNF